MFFTDFLILILVDVIVPSEIFYFALRVLGLSYEDLQKCRRGEDHTTVVFNLLCQAVRENNLKKQDLKTKFDDIPEAKDILKDLEG